MISFRAPLSPTPRKMMPELESSSKKRKLEDSSAGENCEKPPKSKTMNSIFQNHLPLETPLPLEWQRCLDVKSGQIYFYNTRTHKRAPGDESVNPVGMSLDLELNLPCGGSVGKTNMIGGLTRSPSWLTVEGDQREMVTAVCKKCHMLVMMCRACPSCPNCKFVHPQDQVPSSLFTQRLSLLC